MKYTLGLTLLTALTLALGACTGGEKDKAADDKTAKTPAAEEAKGKKETVAAKGAKAPAAGDKAPAAKVEMPALPDGPIAKVNGVEVSKDEFQRKFEKMTRAFTRRGKEIPPGLAHRYRESILKQLIDKELLNQKIKAGNVKIDEAALAKEFEDYKKMFRTDDNFQRYLKSSEITPDQIKDNIRHTLAVKQLLKTEGTLSVEDKDIKEYYETNKKRYEVKEQVRASHILLKVDKKADDKAKAAVKKKADEVHGLATKKGADFAALAREHSQGPTASRGGDLSFFTKGRMVPEFEKVAFTMKANDISKPVLTQFGWHIIKVTDKKEGRQRPFAEVKESIAKLLQNKKSRRAKAALLKKLKEEGKVENFLPKPPPTKAGAPGALAAPMKGMPKGLNLKKLPGKPVQALPKAPAAAPKAAPATGK